jgi:hypothetical protein
MIEFTEAKKKAKSIMPVLEYSAALKILERQLELNPENHDDNLVLRALTLWIENRLAQPHLKYLSKDQVNGVWGGSLTDALVKLGKNYNLAIDPKDPKIGSDFMRAILDGTISNEPPIPSANSYDWLEYQVKNAKYPLVNKSHAGHEWRTGTMEMNVVGIRGYIVPRGAVINYGNQWNDAIFIAWIDARGQKHCKAWAASTDPGRYYTHVNPINAGGTAHLVPGQYAYVTGWHKSPANVAFNQAGNKNGNVLCYRLNADTKQIDGNTKVTEDSPNNRYWINIHTGFSEGFVEYSSAGCQVIKSNGWYDWRWISFRDTLLQNKGGYFWYTLLNSGDLKI